MWSCLNISAVFSSGFLKGMACYDLSTIFNVVENFGRAERLRMVGQIYRLFGLTNLISLKYWTQITRRYPLVYLEAR